VNQTSLRILVTAVNGDLGQAVVKALRLCSSPVEIYGCDANPRGVGAAFVYSLSEVPFAREEDRYISALEEICRANQIDAVVPASEPEISTLAKLGSPLRLPSGTVVVCQEAPWLELYGDKLLCMRALDGKVPLARFADGNDRQAVHDLVNKAGFPLVVKSRKASGSKSLRMAHNHAELALYLAEISSPMVQQYIDDTGGEFSAGVFACQSFQTAVAFRRQLGQVGCSWYAESSEDSEVLDYVCRIMSLTGLRGSANVQVRKGSSGTYLLEINPRFSSLVAARSICGFRDAEWSVRLALDLEMPVPPTNYSAIRFQRFFHEEVDFGHGFRAVTEWSPEQSPSNDFPVDMPNQ
jgi:carbamoyl-phosphate synthase large subunit